MQEQVQAEQQVIHQDAPTLKLSRDPNKAIEEMMLTIDKLRETLVEETKVLQDADTKSFLDLQDQKLIDARQYMDGISQLLSRKEELKAADPSLKDLLEQKREQFAEVTHNNHAAIQRMQSGMKRLGDRIMETAREAARREKEIIYSARGQMQTGLNASIGINESA